MKINEIIYVYHASYLPDLAKGLRSIIARGLVPSKDGYYGPGVYFAYRPEDCYYHVDKENATMFRTKWSDLKGLYGVYPENKNGIQSDGEQVVIPGRVPADLLEVEYFDDEWWDLRDALASETRDDLSEYGVMEAEKDTPAADEIYSTLQRNGYELLGSGLDATVWAKKDSRDVLKIIMPEHGRGAGREAETFYKFYEFCKQHQNLENLPRFVQIGGNAHSVFTADGRDYVMIGMERLSPIPHGSFAEAMVWILSDLASSGLKWEEAWDTIRSERTWDKWEIDDGDDTRSSPVMPTLDVLTTIDSWDAQDAAKWGVLYTLMVLLYHTGRINKQAWDLHTENAMVRGNDMIVITDPWIAQSVE